MTALKVVPNDNAPARLGSIVLYSGARIDLDVPRPEQFFLKDLAELLARTEAVPCASGFYSLAQRAVLMANELASEEGTLTAAYALIFCVPYALARQQGQPVVFGPIFAAVAEAFALDFPMPESSARAILIMRTRLELTEHLRLRRGTEPELVTLRSHGVTAIRGGLVPLSWDKACAKWLSTWKTMATVASLPRTPQWGIA